eukprot:jgi/Astpho2/8842/Aster-x1544
MPQLDSSQIGESFKQKGNEHTIKVSNADGYLCHVTMLCSFRATAQEIFAILSNPDNTGVFRDIKQQGGRTVMSEEDVGAGKRRVVMVEQKGETKVTEDTSKPDNFYTKFELQQSDIMSRFHGTWAVKPESDDPASPRCSAVLEQEVLPKGVPSFLAQMPVLGSALRGICVRAVERMIEDIEAVVDRTRRSGKPVEQVLKDLGNEHRARLSKEEKARKAKAARASAPRTL